MSIFISKLGAISAIGNNIEEHLEALRKGETGIHFNAEHQLMLGKVDLSNEELKEELKLNTSSPYSRTSLLSFKAALEAWENEQQSLEIRTGLISSSSLGGLDRMEAHFFENIKLAEEDRADFIMYDMGQCTDELAAILGISTFVNTISTACSSGANAIMHGARLIKANKLDRVIVGGVDPLAIYNIKGFSALGIYDTKRCRPFDEQRAGLNLGEGAAYLLLENEKSLNFSKNQAICKIAGWANTTDAYHQTASSAEGLGASLAMQQALVMAGIKAKDIGYINTHGTGTLNNDLSESRAMRTVFGEDIPPFGSTKALTGHTLGAAGAIEAVFAILALQHQTLWPMPNFQSPIPEIGLIPIQDLQQQEIEYSLSNSFGFGGNCSCLIFQKV